MPASPKVRYTYTDYLATPEDSSRRYEVVEGDLFVTASPRWRHQQVVSNIHRILSNLVLAHALGEVVPGPVTIRLADDTVLEPDVVFLRSDRLGLVDANGRVLGPPDLVVEVLSPSNRSYDRNLKRRRYQAAGVPELWIVDADANVLEVWRPETVVPERPGDSVVWRVGDQTFEIPLADVFRA
jgi:Uma2 family endonuclease